MPDLKVVSEYQPAGDQPQAIDKLAQGLESGLRAQVLKGVTGSGKTYTMAKVIERVNRPTLVLAHNKTLAAQLCEEFREFFPNNAVEYFVSYYDYYQPEAYVPQTDTYIEKDASTNEEIDRLRLSATCALLERRDVIVVSSVSCIYGLGEPDDFARMMISLRTGMTMDRDELLRRLVADGTRSVLFSTHITSDLEKCATHIAFIKDGELQYTGSLDDFRAHYKDVGATLEDIIVRVERRPLDEDAII